MNVPPKYNSLVPAVDQASRILVCLGKNSQHKMSLTDICKTVGIHKSKGFSILNTLMKYGFVEKDPMSKAYSLGVGLLFLSRNVLDNLNLRDISEPFLKQLALATHNTALFCLISSEQVFTVAKHEGDRKIGVTIRLGHRFHITSGAHGKVLVAHMPENEREALLKRDRLFFYGDSQPVEVTKLSDELARCRELGYAVDLGLLSPGINAVSSAVFGPDQRLIGCIILLGTFEEKRVQQFGSIVAETAVKMSDKIGADTQLLYPCLKSET
ncbi:MAG: IclR family transcriptional regulator [Desulfobacteraceae bacterium]|nr:IclR family transcriptional regulator [Desulfobacteraceae bacterium]